jgi:hypothetical protein
MTAADRTRSIPSRWSSQLIERLLTHVCWYADECRSLSGEASRRPLVLILGREHYSESRKSYPLLRHRDLDMVIRGELADEETTIYVPGEIDGDRREVNFYRLDRDVLEALPRTPIVLPESLVLAGALAEDAWADIDRDGYRYFLFDDGRSQPAGGALGAPRLVALAAGMDPDSEPEQWHGHEQLLGRLRKALMSLPANAWWACRNPLPRKTSLLDIAWRPIGLTAAAAVLGYLVLTTLYLQGTLSLREHALESIAPEVQEGLAADSESRRLGDRQRALAELWSSRADTQLLWAAVASALENGARIAQVQLTDERVSIRGYAPDAAGVLAALTASPHFDDVNFDAPVRADRNGRQNFTLSFVFDASPASGSGADD